MPIETDLNVSPYFDDYDETKKFYQILFRPGVSVQVRELNQLQRILQKQVERFGDNIFKRGTIVDGCNFSFLKPYPYVKLVDNELDGTPASVSLYQGYFAINEDTGLSAFIVNYEDGFEASDPDLKTIFVHYNNSGDDGNTFAFAPGDTLKIYDANNSIFNVAVENGGVGFSNSDEVIVTSAIVVNVSTGTITNGSYITNLLGANVQVVGVDADTLADTDQIILRLQPRDDDLANATANASAWTVANGQALTNSGNTIAAVIEGIVGGSCDGIIRTNGVGTITDFIITNRGSEYTTLPTVRVRSANNTSGLSALDLRARNFLAQIQVSDLGDAVGNGYAFSVTGGVVYQKGYFQRVDPQVVLVEKYSSSPNAVAVGFRTDEEIIDSNIDDSLLDNALGSKNYTAPGANRLKLDPVLTVLSSEDANANDEFFTLVEFAEGQPFKINQSTAYNKINDEMASRTYDESGNFVVDRFNVTTRSPISANAEGKYFSVVVDPGVAYIKGYRISTSRNFTIDVEKGIDSSTANNQRIALDYGNYIRVKEIGGVFQFSTGDTIDLYNTAKGFLSNVAAIAAADLAPVGTKIGTARIRSLIHEDGAPGVNTSVYQLYLFNIEMNSGRTFKDVRSVYYNGTKKGIADLVLEPDPTTAANVAIVRDSNNSTLLFYSGVASLKNANLVNYTYRTIDQTETAANTGIIVKDISASPDEFFPYSGALSTNQLRELYVVPLDTNLKAASDLTGNVTTTTTSANVVGAGTTFLSDLVPGDYVWVYANSTGGGEVKKVVNVVNNTFVTLSSNISFANTDANLRRYFPRHVPVPFGNRSGLTANVDANGNILTIDFGMSFDVATTSNVALAVNIERTDAAQSTKTPVRKRFVKLRLANNSGNTLGPWCIGVPDAFRLRGVYVDTDSGVANTDVNAVDDFYIDHNQTANKYGLSYLYKRPDSNFSLTSSTWLLVEFDYFTTSGPGYYSTVSYLSANATQVQATDSLALEDLSSTVNSFEIPEVFTDKGEYFDLKNQFDFRPYVSNTAAPNATHGSAPVNPAATESFGNTADPANDLKFPLPSSTLEARIEQYLGRRDKVMISRDSNIYLLKGTPAATSNGRKLAASPSDSLLLNIIDVPPYPGLPLNGSNTLSHVLNTHIANEKYSTRKYLNKIIKTANSSSYNIQVQQPRRYTQSDVGSLDRRIQALEYYVSLNLLESDIRNRIIPSSVDPSLDRFKYGFFVDDFTSGLYSDIENPQYAATIIDDDVVPDSHTWAIPGPNNCMGCAYIDYTVISQNNATETGPTVNCTPDGLLSNTIVTRQQASTTQIGNTASAYVDTYNITMANSTGGATLWFYHYNQFNKIEVYQGNTLLRTTNDATALTNSDITFLVSNAVPSAWMNSPSINLATTFTLSGGYTKYAGKLTWTHNPSNGREYSIKVSKGASATTWRYVLQYPINTATVDCPFPPQPNTPVVYTGSMFITPNRMEGVVGTVPYVDEGRTGDAGSGGNGGN